MKPALFVCICRQVHLSLCMCHGCTSVYEYLVVFVQTFAAALGVRFLACLRAVIALSFQSNAFCRPLMRKAIEYQRFLSYTTSCV